jgi:SAM-dependent methyltransferase
MTYDRFTQERWEAVWGAGRTVYDPDADFQLRDSLALISRFWPDPRGRFLEAGCGPAANALNLALRGAEVVGIDLSANAVRMARREFEQRGLSGEFVLGDVRALPFGDGSFDLVYAGGVVEHFAELDTAVGEMVRVLRPGGRVLVTVPALTLSYPYLFLRGNVPAVPLAERAVAALHFGLLRGRFAPFGYERSFTRRRIRRVLERAGLAGVEVGRFDTYLPLLQLSGLVRPLARSLARTDAFAPMYYVTGSRPPYT